MTQENLNELKAAKATFEKYASDLNIKIQKLEAQINSEFTYPMWFKSRYNGLIVKFTSLDTGTVVFAGSSTMFKAGHVMSSWHPHTDTSVWTQIPEPKPQWVPKGGEWTIRDSGSISQITSDEKCAQFVTEYQTKEQAEWARDHMRRFNRLLAYVAEFDVGADGRQWKPNWNNKRYDKYFIYEASGTWDCSSNRVDKNIQVYMSEKCAKELVEKLNSGEVVL